MDEMHPVLKRQLQKAGIDPSRLPTMEAFRAFLDGVQRAYRDADDNRSQLERSLELSSDEMRELYEQLSEQHQQLESAYEHVLRLNEELKTREDQLHRMATRDALTQLPNRTFFLERLAYEFEKTRRYPDYRFALLYLDLDRFKLVNDSLGHQSGDELLRQVADRLKGITRGIDLVARLGSDEFGILVEDVEGPEDALDVAERIHRRLSRPFKLNGTEASTGASVGIALNRPNQTADAFLRDADVAMFRAKQQGHVRTVVFDAAKHDGTIGRLVMENDLRRGLGADEFVLHYQPIIDLQSGELAGVEALVRWQHPEQGLLYPGKFIGIAEESGEILALGAWVLLEACRQMSEWNGAFADQGLFVTVNMSVRQLVRPDLVQDVRRALDVTGLDPSRLKLEVVESIIIDAMEEVRANLHHLRDMGVGISLDDFGTGYSSLSFLHRMPADTIKIDRTFVSDMHTQPLSEKLVRAIVGVAHNLGIDVIAEGIELPEHCDALKNMGCRLAQGFFFARGLPPAELLEFAKTHRS